MTNGGHNMADGGHNMADGGPNMAEGRHAFSDEDQKMALGHHMTDVGRNMADGGPNMADGGHANQQQAQQLANNIMQESDITAAHFNPEIMIFLAKQIADNDSSLAKIVDKTEAYHWYDINRTSSFPSFPEINNHANTTGEPWEDVFSQLYAALKDALPRQ